MRCPPLFPKQTAKKEEYRRVFSVLRARLGAKFGSLFCISPSELLAQVVTDELHLGLRLITLELRDMWKIKCPPFFYPASFLDLHDAFLTGKLLVREVDMYVPRERLAETPR